MTVQQRRALETIIREHPFAAGATLEERRAQFHSMFAVGPLPEGIATTAGTLGGRPVTTATPAGVRPGTALLYLHGGGYVVGSDATGLPLAAALAHRTGTTAHALDYRLAPEVPFPGALEDAVAACAELAHHGDRIVVAGDSAGGGLAVALLVALRDRGLSMPAGAAVFSPFADLALTGETLRTRRDLDPVLTPDALQGFAAAYLRDADPRSPLASPLHADLTGLPPLLIQAGTREVLLDDAVRLADRAADAGVDVVLDVVPGGTHVFQTNAGMLDEADGALDRAAAFLVSALDREAVLTPR